MEGAGNLSTVVKSLYPKANKLVLGDQFPSDFGESLYIGLVEKVTYFQDMPVVLMPFISSTFKLTGPA